MALSPSLSMNEISNIGLESSDCSPPCDKLLSAEAPMFVPRSNSSPSLTTLPNKNNNKNNNNDIKPSASISMLVPSPHAKALVHVYTTPGGVAYHHITTHLPHYRHRSLCRSASIGGSIGKSNTIMGQEIVVASSNSNHESKKLTEQVCNKIINQVEFYFSDINLATTDHLIKIMRKDNEGYVPISTVASFKKIKALVSSHAQLAKILQNSTKLVVSEDGKKVKRQHYLTEADMEEIQSRIIIAENLPKDHCHQNLMKIFSTVGSVKIIRTCQPQAASSGGSSHGTRTTKSDSIIYSNKLHAFVEYETVEIAEKAVVELNDHNNWRNGLKVRPLLKCTGEEETEKEGQWRAHTIGRGKEQAIGLIGNNRVNSNCNNMTPIFAINADQLAYAKHAYVPRMPDGTRGFSMGRGKPMAIKTA